MRVSRSRWMKLLISLVLVSSCAVRGSEKMSLDSWQPEDGISRLNVLHDGFKRELLVQLPRGYDPAGSYPLVLAFHGAGRSCDDWPDWLGDVAENHDFIGIYPTGVHHSWESLVDGRLVDDVAFAASLIAWADTTLAVDQYKRYALGFSQGAIFVNRLACRITGLKGIAAISGSFYENPKFSPVGPPRKIFLAQGLYDGVIPYEGGMNDSGYSYEPAESSARMWSRALGCNAEPATSSVSKGITQIRYSPCRGAADVLLLKVEGGHHLQDSVDGLFTMVWDFWESGGP
ncbi:alpha/beta hydrolase family esterase [Gemmatimonadota bacterium]